MTPSKDGLRRMKAHFKRFLKGLGIFEQRGVRLCRIDGVWFMLDLSCASHRAMYENRSFEPVATRIVTRLLRPGEAFVDVGAHVGWYALHVLAKRPDVPFAYAYEPATSVYRLLARSITANGCADRCVAARLAISSASGYVRLKQFGALDPMHSSIYALGDAECEEEEVPCDTLDNLAAGFKASPGVVKCDVEGAEREVLLGAQRLLGGAFGQPPIWFMEANYETSAMAGFFPWQLIDIAAECSPYKGYYVRRGRVVPLPRCDALRHGDTLIMAVPDVHEDRLTAVPSSHHGDRSNCFAR